MPGILEEGLVTSGDGGEASSCKAPEAEPKVTKEEGKSVESETPSPGPEEDEEGCKVHWQSGTSDSGTPTWVVKGPGILQWSVHVQVGEAT